MRLLCWDTGSDVLLRADAPRTPPSGGWLGGDSDPSGPRAWEALLRIQDGETDEELREAWDRLLEAGVKVVGIAGHTVTHSLHIEDPGGNEIKLYIDVQPERWREDPQAIVAEKLWTTFRVSPS